MTYGEYPRGYRELRLIELYSEQMKYRHQLPQTENLASVYEVDCSTGPSGQQERTINATKISLLRTLPAVESKKIETGLTLYESLDDAAILARKIADFDWDRAFDLKYLDWFFDHHVANRGIGN